MQEDRRPEIDDDALETEIAYQYDQFRNKVSRIQIRKDLEKAGYRPEECKYIMRQLDVLDDERLARGRKVLQGITISITAAGLFLGGLFFIFIKPLFPTVVEVYDHDVLTTQYKAVGFWMFFPYIKLFVGLATGIRGFIIFREVRAGDNKIDPTAGAAPKL